MTKTSDTEKRRRTPEADNPDQYRRFVETARELEADESPDAMDRAFKKVIHRSPPDQSKKRQKKEDSR
jgi:hypothetical protein